MKTRTLTLAVITLTASTVFAFQQGSRVETPVAAKLVNGVQTIKVVVSGGKYSPSLISVKKGKPVAITFTGGKNIGCGATIVFKSLNQKQTVSEGKSVTFKFTPSKVGTIKFACPMDMYQGKIIVK